MANKKNPINPVNERIRLLAQGLDMTSPRDFGRFLGLLDEKETTKGEKKKAGSTERIRKIWEDMNQAGLETILLIATKVAEKKHRKVNTHWIITGDGPTFLDEKPPEAEKPPQKEQDIVILYRKVANLELKLEEIEKGRPAVTN